MTSPWSHLAARQEILIDVFAQIWPLPYTCKEFVSCVVVMSLKLHALLHMTNLETCEGVLDVLNGLMIFVHLIFYFFLFLLFNYTKFLKKLCSSINCFIWLHTCILYCIHLCMFLISIVLASFVFVIFLLFLLFQ